MNRKTMSLLSDLPPATRRRFLQGLGVALAAPAVPPALRYAVNEVLCGEAYAQSAGAPTFFIEVNLRDQQDLGSIFVPPGLAKNVNLQRGDCGKKVSLFHEMNTLKLVGRNQYLTPDSIELEPHVGSIACIDLFELTPGNTHYHQSANRTRAPDCSMDTKMPGQIEMWTLDKPLYSFPTGTEKYHCAIPTPATMHNAYQKKLNPALLNGIAFKGISRQKHAVYHCAGSLPTTAELDRMTDKAAVDKKFTGKSGTPLPPGLVPTADEAELLVRVLKKVDPSFLKRRSYGQKAIDDHLGLLGEAQGRLKPPPMMPPGMNPGMTPPVNLALTAEEIAFWKTGVPEQDGNGKTIVPGFKVIQDGDTPRKVNFQGWEQYALAWKLVSANLCRSIAIECEFIDWHDTRPEGNMKAYTWCTARPLARLISNLKKAGLYNNTLIAVYTTDGSRAPSSNSSGDQGKNTVILAGGMLEGKGGYYGDIEATGMETAGNCAGTGHSFIYRLPDLTSGAPTGGTAMGSAKEPRIKGAVLWKTVMRLLKVPETEYAQFPLVAGARTLDFLL